MRRIRSGDLTGDHGVDSAAATNPAADFEVAVLELKAQTAERIRNALVRLEKGTYGMCDDCGERIGEARLLVLPFASRCKSCQELLDQRP